MHTLCMSRIPPLADSQLFLLVLRSPGCSAQLRQAHGDVRPAEVAAPWRLGLALGARHFPFLLILSWSAAAHGHL